MHKSRLSRSKSIAARKLENDVCPSNYFYIRLTPTVHEGLEKVYSFSELCYHC